MHIKIVQGGGQSAGAGHPLNRDPSLKMACIRCNQPRRPDLAFCARCSDELDADVALAHAFTKSTHHKHWILIVRDYRPASVAAAGSGGGITVFGGIGGTAHLDRPQGFFGLERTEPRNLRLMLLVTSRRAGSLILRDETLHEHIAASGDRAEAERLVARLDDPADSIWQMVTAE